MPRKDASFAQLIKYITDDNKADKKYFYGHNTFSNDPEVALKAIEENAKYLKQRKNGNTMYHEVVSITKEKGVDPTRQKEALYDITIQYINRRASNNIVFSAMHDDHDDHLHCHIMLSANEIGSSKKTRLSKNEFSLIKQDIEKYVLTKYPELKQGIVIGKENDKKAQIKDKEIQVKKRGKTSQVERLSDAVGRVIQESSDEADLESNLKKYGIEYYRRGKTPGIIDTEDGKKYRLKRLGLIGVYEKMLAGKNKNQADLKNIKTDAVDAETKKEKTEKLSTAPKDKDVQDTLSIKDHVKEWVLGDFEKRESLTNKDRQKELKEETKITGKDRLKEWGKGDFTSRDKKIHQDDYKKMGKRIFGDEGLTSKDKRDAWLKGDFAGREDQSKAEKIKQWLDKRKRTAKENAIKSRKEKFDKIRKLESEDNKSHDDSQRRK